MSGGYDEGLRETVADTIYEIANNFHYAEPDGQIEDARFPNGLTFMTLSYLMDKNHLLVGDPGFGKTSGGQLISSTLSGLPFDLYESLMMQGHAGQYEEKIVGRPDYGELQDGEESVRWQGYFGLDSLIVDEGNRAPGELQGALLEGIRTGRWNYLNEVMFEGKKPTFMTVNHRDEGNEPLLPPLRDRFHVATAEEPIAPFYDFRAAKERIDEELRDDEFTQEVLETLAEEGYGEEFKELIEGRREREGRLTPDDKEQVQEQIGDMRWTNDAKYLLWTFYSDINFSDLYGVNRSNDPKTGEDHDVNRAVSDVNNPVSPRVDMAAEDYSEGLAWLLGDEEVTVDHVRHVLPYTASHKLDFHDDFRAEHEGSYREDRMSLHLAQELVKDVWETYDETVRPQKDLVAKWQKLNRQDVPESEKQRIQEELDGMKPRDFDHPLLRQLLQRVKGEKSPENINI